MENIIKETVQSQLRQVLNIAVDDSNDGMPKKSTKKRKTETRLSDLLSTIKRKKSNKATEQKESLKKVHFKWMRYDPIKYSEYIVSQKHGGGFRYLTVESSVTMEHLKSKAIDIFFPSSHNFFGESATDCQISLTNASGGVLNHNMTLKDFVKVTGMYLSRTYFILHSKHEPFPLPLNYDNDNIQYQENVMFQNQNIMDMLGNQMNIMQPNMGLVGDVPQENVPLQNPQPNQLRNQQHNQQEPPQQNQQPGQQGNQQEIQQINQFEIQQPCQQGDSQEPDQFRNQQTNQQENQQVDQQGNPQEIEQPDQQGNPQEIQQPNQQESDERDELNNSAYADTIPVDPADYQDLTNEEGEVERELVVIIPDNRVSVTVHRTSMKDDIINAFKTIDISKSIEFKVIDPRGKREEGRGSGVDRDIYTSVWREIFDSLCVGDRERVPYIRHDLFIDDWKSIGKILVKGYIDTGYYPMELSKAFILNCLYNDVHNDILIDSFFLFLSPSEERIVREALNASNPDVYDDEEFLDLLDRFNCRSRVHPLNVYGVIKEIARQELIQRPYLMVCSWRKVLTPLRSCENFESLSSINAMYKKVIPTNQNVIRLFAAIVNNDGERETFKYLKQYVRGLNQPTLKKFLHFCTGADIIVVGEILVSFVVFPSDFARRPVAHTCQPLLELSSSYRSFCELREEFENVLRSSSWEMDTY